MELLRVENLCKRYGGRETGTDALKGVSFTVEKGEFVAIVGPSGSGKSTLLHILGGVDRPTSGRVLVDGADVYQHGRKRPGHLPTPPDRADLPVLQPDPGTQRGGEHHPAPAAGRAQGRSTAGCKDLLETLGLGERLGHLPSQLSGGQQQRVSIGRALIASPALVLADEPTGNLDSKNSGEIIGLLRDFHRTLDQTLIVITHDERIALQADRIIAIEDGQIARDEVIRR